MTKSGAALFALVALLGWSLEASAGNDSTASPEPPGVLTGRVVDMKGRALPGARVWATSYGWSRKPVETGMEGGFRLSVSMLERPVTVWADAKGVARARVDDVHVFAGHDRDLGRLTLLPGTRILGRVVDERGEPIAKASVTLNLYHRQLGHTIIRDETEPVPRTSTEGRFETLPLAAGSAEFCFVSPGKVRTILSRKAEPGTAEADLGDITLPDEILVSGAVVDQDGEPAPGVQVVADYDWEHPTKTDERGQFTLHGLGKDVKLLQLRSNAYFAPKPFDIKPGQTDLKLTVTKAYEIHGKAVDAETGQPVRLDTVRLCTVDREPDGHYTLAG